MIDKKTTGSYYTPTYLTDFIAVRVLNNFKKNKQLSILEPSAGPGPFVKSLDKYSNKRDLNVTAVDINEVEIKNISNTVGKNIVKKELNDFLNFEAKNKYDVVIGNPPYVKKMLLSKEQREKCKEIHKEYNLTESSSKNLWATFLVKSMSFLSDDGVLAFVLPAEMLQVTFAEEIRTFIKINFERIEIFTFDELQFDCKGQDTIVLFAYKKAKDKGEYFTNIKNSEALLGADFLLKKNESLVSSTIKWTHHFLTRSDLEFLSNIRSKVKTVENYAVTKPGIVTGANSFFIMSKAVEHKYNLQQYTKPIIQKGIFLTGGVVFSESNVKVLEEGSSPSRLLVLNNETKITRSLEKYLVLAKSDAIPQRYKCRIRKNWYVVPNVSNPPQAMFFKRSHLYPRVIKNNTESLVTDAAYKIELNESYDLDSFIFSFYNSLTLLFSEIDGRYYGGGVLELIPKEFQRLPLPYKRISKNKFDRFSKNFLQKNSIEDILEINDQEILYSVVGLAKDEIFRIQNLRRKLIDKRLRK